MNRLIEELEELDRRRLEILWEIKIIEKYELE
jgi:hypothetical protein